MDVRHLHGRCECRAVRYRVEDAFLYAANCHCSNCRAATGSAFKSFAGVESGKLEITQGGDNLFVWETPKGATTRCGTCGGFLFFVLHGGEHVHVALGSLEDEPTVRPSEHIFVGSKAPWFEITDDLIQNETL
jgi:hypothetical protein